MRKITIEQIKAAIIGEHYFTAADGRFGAIENGSYVGKETPMDSDEDLEPLERVMFCALVLMNGFVVTGTSACADPESFDAETGRKLAYADAIRQCWPYFGFLLREEIAEQAEDEAQAQAEAEEQIDPSTLLMLALLTGASQGRHCG